MDRSRGRLLASFSNSASCLAMQFYVALSATRGYPKGGLPRVRVGRELAPQYLD